MVSSEPTLEITTDVVTITQETQIPEAALPATEDIEIESVPLSNLGLMIFAPMGTDVWAVLNLMLAIMGALLALGALIINVLHKRRVDKEEKNKLNSTNQEEIYMIGEEKTYHYHRLEWLVVAIVLGCAGVLIFALTQDVSKTMTMIDRWTLTHAVLFTLELIAFRLMHRSEEDIDDKEVKTHHSSMVFK